MASSYYLDSTGRRWGKGGTPSILEMFLSFEYSSIRKTQDLFLPFSSLCTSGYGVIYLTDKSGNNLYAHLSLSSRSGGWVPPHRGLALSAASPGQESSRHSEPAPSGLL